MLGLEREGEGERKEDWIIGLGTHTTFKGAAFSIFFLTICNHVDWSKVMCHKAMFFSGHTCQLWLLDIQVQLHKLRRQWIKLHYKCNILHSLLSVFPFYSQASIQDFNPDWRTSSPSHTGYLKISVTSTKMYICININSTEMCLGK